MTKLLAVLCVCATAVLGLSSAATAAPADPAAAVTSVRVAAADAPDFSAAAINSSKCGATVGWGKIKYQACFAYTCTSVCSTQGYLGIINTATSSRTVTWDLDVKSPWVEEHDDSGTWTLAAAGSSGAQKTIYSGFVYTHPGCGFSFTESLKIKYDSAGFSPYVSATAVLPCG